MADSVRIFGRPHCQGDSLELAIGTYNHCHIRSAQIPDHMELAVGADANAGINLVMAAGDSSGSDVQDMVWGYLNPSDFPLVTVRKKKGGPTGLLRGTRNGRLVWWYLPYGRSHAGADWLNDGADTIILPPDVTAQVWRDGTFQGSNTRLHGKDGGETRCQGLGLMAGQVSAVEITSDALEAVGKPELLWDQAKNLGNSTRIGSSAVLTNTSSSEATLSTEIGVEASSTAESNWSDTTSAGGSISSETKVGTGESSPVQVEQTVSVSVTFDKTVGRGGSHSDSNSRHITQTVESTCPPHSSREIQMLVARKRQEVPVRQKLRNTVTGDEIWVSGTVTLDLVTDTQVKVKEPQAQ